MGFLQSGGRQLASVDDVVPHVGLSIVRFEALRTSPDQRVAACRQHRSGLSASARPDGTSPRRGYDPASRSTVAERAGGGDVWAAPVACGIGGVGGGAQGRVEHVLRAALVDRIYAICDK